MHLQVIAARQESVTISAYGSIAQSAVSTLCCIFRASSVLHLGRASWGRQVTRRGSGLPSPPDRRLVRSRGDVPLLSPISWHHAVFLLLECGDPGLRHFGIQPTPGLSLGVWSPRRPLSESRIYRRHHAPDERTHGRKDKLQPPRARLCNEPLLFSLRTKLSS